MSSLSDCGIEDSAELESSSQPSIKAPFDTVRAIVVFASFPESSSVQETQCGADSVGWPDRLTIPDWAFDLIEDTDVPTEPGSVTHFLYEMSDRDNDPSSSAPKHVLRGTVFPSVVETPLSIAEYHDLSGEPSTSTDAVTLANSDVAREVILTLGDDALDYDVETDGFFDFMFIFYRERRDTSGALLWTGGSAFTGNFIPADTTFTTPSGTISLGPEGGASILPWVAPTGHRIYDKWFVGGAMAHEYCHHIFGPLHLPESMPFAMMNGGQGSRPGIPSCPHETERWSTIASGYNRLEVGWIDPIEIDSTVTGADTTIVLKSAALDGSEAFAVVQTSNEDQIFLLECRGDIGSTYLEGVSSATCPVNDNFSGLVVTHIAYLNKLAMGWHACNVDATFPWAAPLVDFELATGMIDTTSWAIDPVRGIDSLGRNRIAIDAVPADLFQPGLGASGFSNAFTPYTNPSTQLYPDSTVGNHPPIQFTYAVARQDVYSGISIYNIEWANAGHDSMRVSIRFDGSTAPSGADTIRVDTTWDGRMQLSNDVVVAPGVELTIEEGSQIIAKASDTSDKVALETRGTSTVNGSVSEPVEFLSSRDGAFDHYLGSGEYGETAAPGDWGGLEFNLEGAYVASYGYLESVEPVSRVKNSAIADAEAGIRIVNHIAPGIEGVTFSEIEDDREILLDGTDVVVPKVRDAAGGPGFVLDEAIWDLLAPTTVVATNDPDPDEESDDIDDLTEFNGEANDLVDLIFQGRGFTSSAVPGTYWVNFVPDSITTVGFTDAANDWGGIFLHSYASGSVFENADIGYASTPLFVHYPHSSTTIRDCRIHHFGWIGLWIFQTIGSGALVEGTTIERGAGLHSSLGNVGVFLDKTTNLRFGSESAPNLINLDGAVLAAGGYGIAASLGKTLCLSDGTTDTLRIANTTVVGPGASGAAGDWSGIHLNWLCGSEHRTVEVESNWLEDFDLAGIDLEQVVDVQVSCNKVVESLRGLSFSRDSEAYGPGVRFRENSFEQNVDGDVASVATDASFKVKMGPESSGDKGRNVFKVWNEDTAFVLNDDFSSDVLDATHNWWYLQDGSGETFLDSLTVAEHPEIDARCRASTGGPGSADSTVNVLSHKRTHTNEPECPARHPDAPGGSRIAGSPPVVGGPVAVVRLDASIPLETRLGRPYPNPATGGVTLPFSLSRKGAGPVRLEVFDVGGRRVRTLANEALAAAEYQLLWSGLDNSGGKVSPGIYFVRFTAGEHVETTKVTVLR